MRTEIWAHRGASAVKAENTLPAFETAIRMGADGIELDVHLSSDGAVVVTHDESLNRLTGYDGSVSKLTLAELRRLDFGFAMAGCGRQTIPTLAETFDLVRPSKMVINIELKNTIQLYPGLAQKVLDLAEEHGMAERIVLSSFNHYSMVEAAALIRERGWQVPCGLLYSSTLYEPWVYAGRLGLKTIHPMLTNLLIPGLVDQCHASGVAINVWTVDKPEFIRRALDLGVDAIITNVPDKALAIRDGGTAGT